MWSIIFCYAMVLSLLVTAIILFCNDLYYKIPVVDVDDLGFSENPVREDPAIPIGESLVLLPSWNRLDLGQEVSLVFHAVYNASEGIVEALGFHVGFPHPLDAHLPSGFPVGCTGEVALSLGFLVDDLIGETGYEGELHRTFADIDNLVGTADGRGQLDCHGPGQGKVVDALEPLSKVPLLMKTRDGVQPGL